MIFFFSLKCKVLNSEIHMWKGHILEDPFCTNNPYEKFMKP